jgi:hypothetical protein
MPKATRAKDSQETPKKRSRKTQPTEGNGTDAVQPVTTAPAIAETTSKISASQATALPSMESWTVSEELVRRRAYELYLQRRGMGGSPEQDWFRALQEISGQHVA